MLHMPIYLSVFMLFSTVLFLLHPCLSWICLMKHDVCTVFLFQCVQASVHRWPVNRGLTTLIRLTGPSLFSMCPKQGSTVCPQHRTVCFLCLNNECYSCSKIPRNTWPSFTAYHRESTNPSTENGSLLLFSVNERRKQIQENMSSKSGSIRSKPADKPIETFDFIANSLQAFLLCFLTLKETCVHACWCDTCMCV